MMIIYIDPKDKDPHHDQNSTIDILKKAGIEFTEADIKKTTRCIISHIVETMRKEREKLSPTKGPYDKWTYNSLTLPPIIETDNNAYPWWYVREHLDEIIRKERMRSPTKPKLKIRRIRKKSMNDQIEITPESLARINVTMLRIVNGIDPVDIMVHWTEGERAAGMVMWRLAQHYKKNDMLILADMLINKANVADPYKNDRWIGDVDN